jgi:hypothetical protein
MIRRYLIFLTLKFASGYPVPETFAKDCEKAIGKIKHWDNTFDLPAQLPAVQKNQSLPEIGPSLDNPGQDELPILPTDRIEATRKRRAACNAASKKNSREAKKRRLEKVCL